MDERPYNGAGFALGTMHAKERAMARPFARLLGASVIVAEGIDTDAFGTFTGEIARAGTMRDAARAKARRAMDLSGLPQALASEGSYGPHPRIPFIPGGVELALFIDDERDLEIVETIVVSRTNYDTRFWSPGEPLDAAFAGPRIPGHAMTARPEKPKAEARDLAFKAILTAEQLADAARACAAASETGRALLVPDMRAHMNPTRMAAIRRVATKLARRIATPCPACDAPGFGHAAIARGLPCADCGTPTRAAIADIHRCAACAHEEQRPLAGEGAQADPGLCDICNP